MSAAPRFFVGTDVPDLRAGDVVELPESVAHHAIRVVRLGVGDPLTLFTGAGGEHAATVVGVDRRRATVRIESFEPVERESPLAVTLAQAQVANDAMDYAVRKAIEAGVASIQPIVTERSAPFGSGERAARRHAHWRQIAIAACEQCGRNRVPAIADALPLPEWLARWREGGIVLAADGAQPLAALRAPPAAIVVGPEGGLTASEITAARNAGFVATHLGPRTLRTETAGVAALAAANVLWGDWR